MALFFRFTSCRVSLSSSKPHQKNSLDYHVINGDIMLSSERRDNTQSLSKTAYIGDPFEADLFERRDRHFDRGNRSHWSIAWSDLMMTMFIFFVIMYVYQLSNSEFKPEYNSFVDKASEELSLKIQNVETSDAIRESFPEIFELTRKNIPDMLEVDLMTDTAIRITLTNDLLFETGKANLKHGAEKVLTDVARALIKTPYFINVAGHTDNRPIHTADFPTNWELSAVRACIVARYLSENFSISPNRFFITGHAYHKPVKQNNNSKNRAANRRVEIIITKQRS